MSRITEMLDQGGNGKELLSKMPRLLRLHFMQKFLEILEDFEEEQQSRIQPALKLMLYGTAVGRVARAWVKKEAEAGLPDFALRNVFERILLISLEKRWTAEENEIPVPYKLTESGKRVLKKRNATRSSLVGSLILEKVGNDSGSTGQSD